MHEDEKLREAEHFLGQMRSSLQSPEVFRFNLSAFLSAARSVAQYARKEARSKPQGQAWYDSFVNNDPYIKFFADRRDANIHDEIVPLDGHVDVYVKDGGALRDRAVVESFDREGNLLGVTEDDAARTDSDARWTPDFAFVAHYRFAEWQGNEEIPELCGSYTSSLRGLVEDGRRRGILSPPQHERSR